MTDTFTVTLNIPLTPDSIRTMSENEWECSHLQMRTDLQALVTQWRSMEEISEISEIAELLALVEKIRDQGALMTDYLRWRGIPNAPVAPSGWMCRGDLRDLEIRTITDLIG